MREKEREKKAEMIKPKSILKGDKDDEEEEEKAKMNKMNDSNFNINGNIVHVTVNNFITTDKKPESVTKTVANTRPFSSDTK